MTVWYLFPINAVTRQLAIDLNKVDEHKQRSLDGIFGTTEWRSELYAPSLNGDLFDMLATRADRDVGVPEIERYARKRLGTIFRYVSEPLPLLANSRGHLFSLFCLSNSDSDRAIGLIKKGVAGVMKNYGSASHRRSDP